MRKFISLFVFTFAFSMVFSAVASAQTQIITEDDVQRAVEPATFTNDWMLYTRAGGLGVFVNGPATPPSGTGSLELHTPAGADKVWLFNYEHIGTALSAIDAISYSTYRHEGDAQQVAALNIVVDFNGPAVIGGFTTLVFEPVYNTSQGPVQTGIWQSWNAFGGANWWSTRTITGVCEFSCFVSWNAILAANPSATILGGFGVNQGSGNPALKTSVDVLTIGKSGVTTVYDFERDAPPVFTLPTTKEECKNGGWRNFNPPTGPFPNQGQCVASTVRNN